MIRVNLIVIRNKYINISVRRPKIEQLAPSKLVIIMTGMPEKNDDMKDKLAVSDWACKRI